MFQISLQYSNVKLVTIIFADEPFLMIIYRIEVNDAMAVCCRTRLFPIWHSLQNKRLLFQRQSQQCLCCFVFILFSVIYGFILFWLGSLQ